MSNVHDNYIYQIVYIYKFFLVEYVVSVWHRILMRIVNSTCTMRIRYIIP